MIFSSQFADKPVTDFYFERRKSCNRWLISFLEHFNFAWFFEGDFGQLHSDAKFESLLPWLSHGLKLC